jgi:[acyl-carrier-protein] S-malonyltransferase
MATLRALDITATIELPPAGTLSGLVRRDMKGTVTLALKAPEDLEGLAAVIGEHSATAPAGIHA